MQNDAGQVYYLRYYDNGSVYYINQHGELEQIEGDNLPHLLYVGDDGVAYFSKMQHHQMTYFSLDSHGDFDWVDYDDVPGYGDAPPPPVEEQYDYPRVVEYHDDGDGDEGWALVQLEDGRMVRYYEEGGAYWYDEYGNEEAIVGFQVPNLLHVDENGDAYFRVFIETGGEGYRYYMIDVDGGIENIHPDDIPGYEMPPVDGEYEYPRSVEWDADEGWVIIQDENGHYARYDTDGTEYGVDEHGNQLPPNGAHVDVGNLLYVDHNGNAYFQSENGGYPYFMIDHDGGIEPVDYEDIPGYEDLEPPVEGHPPFFFDDFANPFYDAGGLEPDGDPIFANGIYQQTYNNGEVVMTWAQEAGPYQIRYYSEDNAGGYLQLHVTYDPYNYAYETQVYPYDYFDHIEEDFELAPIDHYADLAYLGVPYDNMEIENGEVSYYWYDDDGDLLQKTTVNRVTGEVIYQYDELYIHVDRYGNEYYEGFPDPNWEPPAGYGEVGDLYPPYGMPPYLVFGEGYQYEMQYADPEAAGYELISATPADDPDQWQFIGPNGERVIVSKTDEYNYQFVYQSDPNAPPGQWEMVMDVTTDQYGNYVSYEAVGGEYYDEYIQVAVEEGDYNPAWAEYYNPDYADFAHPYSLYGEPDEPFDGQAPNTYVFGRGRAMIVRNEDGSETITWYSEGGYQNGYVEYKATVSYEGGQWVTESDALPMDLIPVYGILPVNGTPIYDPYNDEAPWGEPSEVIIQEDRVIAFWETDDGQIRSEWYRDGSHFREVTYPDGLVISWGNEGWEYVVPDGWVAPEYDGVDAVAPDNYDAQYVYDLLPDNLPQSFEGGYVNPEHGQEYQYYGSESYGGVTFHLFNHTGGESIVVRENPDGTSTIFWHDQPAGELAPPYTEGANASAMVYQNGQYSFDEYADIGVSAVEQFVADGYLPDGAPDYFGNPGWINPEADERFTEIDTMNYSETYDDPPEHLVGAVVRYYNADLDDDGTPDYRVGVTEYADGRIDIIYYNDAAGEGGSIHLSVDGVGNYTGYEVGDNPPPIVPVEMVDDLEPVEPVDIDGLMPDGTPEYFNAPIWVNPEYDERFQEVQYNPDVDGTGTAYRAYRANLDDDPGSEYLINVWEDPDGSVRVEYYHLNELQATIDVITQPDGSYGTFNITYAVSDYYGVPAPGEYEPPVEDPGLAPWTAHLPTHWNMEIGTGQRTNFHNPEADGQVVDYELVSANATERVYVDQFGQYVKITNHGGGDYSFAWGDDLENPELVMGVPAAGNPTVEYTSIGVVDPWAEEVVEEEEDLVVEADGYLPNGAPVFFDSNLWPNPELDNRFEYQYESSPEAGVVARHYQADLDGDGAYDYRVVVMEYPNGTVYVDYGHLNGQGEARFILTQDADGGYNGHDAIYYVDNPQGAPFDFPAGDDPADEGPEENDQPPLQEAEEEVGEPDVPEDPDEGPPDPPPPPPPPGEGAQELDQAQFVNTGEPDEGEPDDPEEAARIEAEGGQQAEPTEEELAKAEEEGLQPLAFNGPEASADETGDEDDTPPAEAAEEVEEVVIAQPEIVEAPVDQTPIVPDDDVPGQDDLEDDDDDGTGL